LPKDPATLALEREVTGETSEKDSPKSSEKSSEKILRLMRENASISASEIGQMIGLTSRAVEKQITGLKAKGRIPCGLVTGSSTGSPPA
jgi:predicted HTH transcriptional regulator